MTAPECTQPITEYDNWVLHRQPEDQIVDHRFSLWSGEHPVVLANEMPGEDGALAYIVSELNSVARLTRLCDAYQGQVEAGAAQIEHLWSRVRKLEHDNNQAAGRIMELENALKALVDNVNDYERVNNLAPNLGRTECWDTVAHAKRVLGKARGGKES